MHVTARLLFGLLVVFGILVNPKVGHAETEVDLALVLAVDVSQQWGP
jgi:hypothetical protein